MSMDCWGVRGIGIVANKIEPYLNVDKCINLIREQTNDEVIPEKDDFDIRDYLYGDLFENLGDLLCTCDDTNTLTWDDGNDWSYYFLYIPPYPWDYRENEPDSIQEVHRRIIAAIQKVCNMSEADIENLIDDDINDVYWG